MTGRRYLCRRKFWCETMAVKCELIHDNFENARVYQIPRAQLIIADIPYNLGNAAFASNPQWWIDGDVNNGASEKAGKAFFRSDYSFNIINFFDFCVRLLRKEPKERGQAPCMIVFCAFQQIPTVIENAERKGFKHYQQIVFVKNYSPQVLKANMRLCGATEYALLLYRDKLPKFNNGGQMFFDWFLWQRDTKDVPKLHPTQKPVNLLKQLIQLYTDPGDVVIDPCAGSGSTLRAAYELGRNAYGFEIDREMCRKAKAAMLSGMGEYKPEAAAEQVTLF